jgi:CHAT domain-containing protein
MRGWALAVVLAARGLGDEPVPREIEQADGVAAERFLVCQTLPMSRFEALDKRLRTSGWRARQVRPYRDKETVRVGAIWERDGRGGRVLLGATAEAVSRIDRTYRAEGFLAVDVAGYIAEEQGRAVDRYCATWEAAGDGLKGQKADLYVGVPDNERNTVSDRMAAADLVPSTMHRFLGADSSPKNSGVWRTVTPNGPAWRTRWGNPWFFGGELAKLKDEFVLLDLVVSPLAPVDRKAILRARLAVDDALVKADSASVSDRYSRGYTRYWLRDDAGAVEDLSAVIAAAPGFRDGLAYSFRALARARLGDRRGAEADTEEFARRYRQSAAIVNLRARIHLALGEIGTALAELDAARKRTPDDIILNEKEAQVRALAANELRAKDAVAAANESQRAVELLARSFEIGARFFTTIDDTPEFDPIRDDPAYRALRHRYQLDREYEGVWRAQGTDESRELRGLTVADHRTKAQALAAQGFVPVSICVAVLSPGQPAVSASVWKRALPPGVIRAAEIAREATRVESAGEHENAVCLWGEVLDLRRRALGEAHAETLRARRWIAEIEFQRKRLTEAEVQFRAIVSAREADHDSSLTDLDKARDELAAVLEWRARALEQSGDFARSMQAWTEAGEQRANAHGDNDWRVLDDKLERADAERLSKMKPEAVDRVRRAERCMARANELFRGGDFDAAVSLAEEAAEIRRQVLGPNHWRLAESLHLLAVLAGRLDDLGRAGSLSRQAGEVRKTALSATHPHYANSLYASGLIARRAGKPEVAAPLLREAMTIRLEALGQANDDYIAARDALAEVQGEVTASLARAGDFKGAGEACRESIDLLAERYNGYFNWHVQDAYEELWNLERLAGLTAQARERVYAARLALERAEDSARKADLAKAVELAAGAEEALRNLLGPRDRESLAASQRLAELHLRRDNAPAAEPILRRVLQARRSALGAESALTQRTLDSVAATLERLGDGAIAVREFATAQSVFREVEQIQRERHGPDHWRTAAARGSLQDLDRLAKLTPEELSRFVAAKRRLKEVQENESKQKPEEGLQVVAGALENLRATVGTGHRTYVMGVYQMARLYMNLDNPALAERLLRQAEPAASGAIGAENPDRVNVLVDLGNVYLRLGEYDRAGPLLRQALEVATRTLGRDDARATTARDGLARVLTALANIALARGDYAAAAQALSELPTLRAEQFGKDHWQARDARLWLAFWQQVAARAPNDRRWFLVAEQLCRNNTGDNAFALPTMSFYLLRWGLSIERQALGPDNLRVVQGQRWLARLAQARGDRAGAEMLYSDAEPLLERVLGLGHPEHASLLHDWGIFALSQGDENRALALLRRALRLCDRAYGKGHPEGAATARELSALLERRASTAAAAGDFAAARQAQRDIIVLTEDLHGRDSYRTRLARLQLDDWATREALDAESRRRLTESDVHGKDADRLYNEGKLAEALAAAERALAIRKAVLGEGHADFAAALFNVAWLRGALGDYTGASTAFRRTLEIRRKVLGNDHLATVESIKLLGWVYRQLGEPAPARALHEEARDIARRIAGADSLAFVSCQEFLGLDFQDEGDLDRALECLDQSLTFRVQAQGTDHPDCATARNNLALLAEARHEYPRAEELFREALRVRRATANQNPLDYAQVLANLGSLYKGTDRPAKAEPLLSEALRLRRGVLGEQNPDTVRCARLLAQVYEMMNQHALSRRLAEEAVAALDKKRKEGTGDLDFDLWDVAAMYSAIGDDRQAEPLVRQILADRHKALGPNHALTIKARQYLCGVLERIRETRSDANDFESARAAGREAVKESAALYGATHWRARNVRLSLERVETMARLEPAQRDRLRHGVAIRKAADDLEDKGRYREAIPMFEEALQIEHELTGEGSRADILLTRRLGRAFHEVRDYGRAEPLLRRSLAMTVPLLGEDHPDVVFSLAALSSLLLESERFEEAEPLCKRGVEVCRRVFGADDMDHARFLCNLGWIEQKRRKNYDRAEALFLEAQAIRKRAKGERNDEFAESFTDLGLLAMDRGDLRRAEILLRRSIDLLREVSGEDHRDTVNAMNLLGGVLSRRGDYAGSIELLRKIIASRTRRFGPTSPSARASREDLAKMLSLLADRCDVDENFDAARASRREAMDLRLELFGKADWRTADARLAFQCTEQFARMDHASRMRLVEAGKLVAEARRLDKAGNYLAAISVEERALAIRRELLGEQHRDYAAELGWLGRFYRLSGNIDKAEPLVRRSVELRATVFGENHPSLADGLDHLLTVLAIRGERIEAIAVARRLVRARVASAGDSAAATTTARERLVSALCDGAQALSETGQFAAALGAARDAAELRATLTGKDHWRALEARAQLADIQRRAKLPVEQRRRLGQAQAQLERARLALRSTKPADALEPARQALEIVAPLLCDEDTTTIGVLAVLGLSEYRAGDRKRAFALLIRAERALAQRVGQQHPDYADILRYQAQCSIEEARLGEAERWLRSALAVHQAALGRSDSRYTATRQDLLTVLDARADAAEGDAAVALRREIEQLTAEAHGKDHWRTTDARLAVRHAEMVRALASPQRKRLDELDAVKTKAEELTAAGHYREAVALLAPRVPEWSELLGPDDPEALDALGGLATLCGLVCDHVRAESLFREYVERSTRVRGRRHPSTALGMQGHADVLADLDEDDKALPLIREAIEIHIANEGSDGDRYITLLASLARQEFRLGHMQQAEEAYRKVADHDKLKGGLAYAASLASLALVVHARGDCDRSREIQEEALDLAERFAKKDDPKMASVLFTQATFDFMHTRFADAARYQRQAVAISRVVMGDTHVHLGDKLDSLARYELAGGDDVAAEADLRASLAIHLGHLDLASALGEDRQLAAHREMRSSLGAWLTLARRGRITAEDAYGPVLAWKGNVFVQQRGVRRARKQPELIPRLDDLERVTRQLAAEVIRGAEPGRSEAWKREVEQLTSVKTRIEEDLSARSEAFRRGQLRRQVSSKQIREALDDDVLLIDLVEYEDFDPKVQPDLRGQPRVAAFLIRRSAPVTRLDLGPKAPIADAVRDWRFTLGAGPSGESAAARLRALLWTKELEQHLKDVQVVLISPDGPLAGIPFGALPDRERGSYLIERYQIAVVPTPRLLPELVAASAPELAPVVESGGKAGTEGKAKVQAEPPPGLLLVGDVDFGGDSGRNLLAQSTGLRRDAFRGSDRLVFPPLPATRKEIDELAQLYRARYRERPIVAILDGKFATEQAFRDAAPRYQIVHLATHGFFSPRLASVPRAKITPMPVSSGAGDRQELGVDPAVDPAALHPGLLSGVALAGASISPPRASDPSRDDGILTALEVAELDLDETDLVVLSACNTGLGRIAGGEGVLGIQRAFQVAGAQASIAAIWPVDDAATQALMIEFYRNLWKPGAKRLRALDALTNAQRSMMRFYSPKTKQIVRRGPADERDVQIKPRNPSAPGEKLAPAYWAAFVFSGSGR